MSDDDIKTDKSIASLVEVTDALLRGEFDHKQVVIDAEGLLSNLAQKINTMMVNMKTVVSPLSSAGEQAPDAINRAESVVELMTQATNDVLNKSDQLVEFTEDLEGLFSLDEKEERDSIAILKESLPAMKAVLFDIIATQSYQDVARQKMEALIRDLGQIRDWLVEALLILNIKKDDSTENVKIKAELLREVRGPNVSEDLKQDLVDDLLAEFGF